MRALALAAVLALTLAGPLAAQDTSLPDAEPKDPQGVLPDQRLEVANKEMAYAAERLDKAAEEGHEAAIAGAFDESRETLREVRELFQRLPQNERAPYEEALNKTEQALNGGDAKAGAAAMRELRQRVLDLVAARG